MLTAFVLLLSVLAVLVVGESVRGQCRRMLSRPLVSIPRDESAFAPTQVSA